MSAISVKQPFSLKTATVKLTEVGGTAASDFSDHISEVTFSPTASTGSFTSVNGKVIQDVSASTWTVTFALIQDLDANGFLRWLLENEGTKFDAEITFADGTDPVDIVITALATTIGGPADGQLATATVTVPADGKPEFRAE